MNFASSQTRQRAGSCAPTDKALVPRAATAARSRIMFFRFIFIVDSLIFAAASR